MSDDFIVNVRQIGQYPPVTAALSSDLLLIQRSGVGGPYQSLQAGLLVTTALSQGGWLQLAPGSGIAWNGSGLSSDGGAFTFTGPLAVPSITTDTIQSTGDIFVAGEALASQDFVTRIFDELLLNSVTSFNGRIGAVMLEDVDILRAGGILQNNPVFSGNVIVPTIWDPRSNDQHAASTAFVQSAICHWLMTAPLVQSFNGRTGAITLTAQDITDAAYLEQGQYIRAPNPALGDVSDRVATCGFVDESIMDLQDRLESELADAISGAYAPINSPQFTGIPTAPTASPGTSTGQLATTAFVIAQVAASTAGVASWNTRTGAVTMTAADVTAAGGALLVSPVFTGNPQAPTPVPGNSSTSIATTAFVGAALAALPAGGVTSFNTRTGAVVLTTADVTGAGGAPLASPAFTGNPTAATQVATDSSTRLATTAFVANALTNVTAGVQSFNSRIGAVTLQANDVSAVGGALLASPNFSGIPTAPTATIGTSSTQIATTAFVQAQIGAISSGVSSWNTRTGAVTLQASDITAVGGALLNSPALVGTPTTPTATPGTNTTQIASTAFVQAALAAAPGGVSSFNSRTGAITLLMSDISAAGGAPINSPSFTGTVSAPTPTPGTNSQQVATTAFVMSAISSSGGVNSFNGRAGAVILNTPDIVSASGAAYIQSDFAPAPSITNNTLWFDTLHGQLYVQYKDPVSNALSWVIANSAVTPQPQPPTRRVLTSGTGTYTTPANVTYLEVEMVGGGGGGYAVSPGAGGNTTFGSTLTCTGGGAGAPGGNPVANGGTATGGDFNLSGAHGGVSSAGIPGQINAPGGNGGSSPFGGAGAGPPSQTVAANENAQPNTGSGGGGAGVAAASGAYGGQGGGAGGYLRKLITSPAATYAYAVGAAGAAGTASGNTGPAGAGGSGIIIVTEHYGS